MAFELAFGISLAIAIGLFAILVLIFVKIRKFLNPDLMRLMSTLHAAIFGYETALVDLIGPRGYRTHVFPEIVKVISTLKEDNQNILGVFDAKTQIDAMNRWFDILKGVGIVDKDSNITTNDDGSYSININECSMSYPIHEVIGQKKGICPLALIVASASNIVDNTKEPEISYSQFYEKGTSTKLKFKEAGE